MRYRRLLPLVATLLLAGVPRSFADQVVYFVNGKAIMVKSVEKGEKFTVLEMEGGGRIGVPTEQISKIEDYVVSQPAAAQPAPPQVAAAPAPPVPAPAAGPTVPLPQPTATTGPGIGGRPLGGPGQNLAGLQPLEIGEDAAPAAAQRLPNRLGALNGGPGVQMLNPGAVRPKAPGGPHRPGGRGAFFAGGRRGRQLDMDRNAPPPRVSGAPPAAAAPPAANTAPPVAQAPPTVNEPEEPPPPPDDPNEEPSDPSAPEPGDSSGNTPGGPS